MSSPKPGLSEPYSILSVFELLPGGPHERRGEVIFLLDTEGRVEISDVIRGDLIDRIILAPPPSWKAVLTPCVSQRVGAFACRRDAADGRQRGSA